MICLLKICKCPGYWNIAIPIPISILLTSESKSHFYIERVLPAVEKMKNQVVYAFWDVFIFMNLKYLKFSKIILFKLKNSFFFNNVGDRFD